MPEKEFKRVVDVRLSPSSVFILVQILLVHYKLTGIFVSSWMWALAPLLLVCCLGLLGLIYNLIINFVYYLNKPFNKLKR
jgi:hypothetical protein